MSQPGTQVHVEVDDTLRAYALAPHAHGDEQRFHVVFETERESLVLCVPESERALIGRKLVRVGTTLQEEVLAT